MTMFLIFAAVVLLLFLGVTTAVTMGFASIAKGGADGDQDVRAQTGGVLTVLTLKADERTQHEGNHERNEDVVGNGGHGGACGGW